VTLALKRKIEIPRGQCAAQGCQRKTGLSPVDVEHRGKSTTLDVCDKHILEVVSPDLRGPGILEGDRDGRGPDATEPVQAAAQAEVAEANEALTVARDVEISSAEDEAFVAELLAEVKGKNKRLEEMKQAALRPMRETIKTIQSWFEPAQAAYAQMESLLKGRVIEYRAKLEDQRRAALRAMQAGETPQEVSVAIVALKQAQAPTTEGISVRRVWSFEIVDASKVPVDFMSVDSGKIRAAVSSGVREINGVRIFEQEIVASRSS
jgi:hypothetical protein